MDKVSDYWKQLLSVSIPRSYPSRLGDLIDLNKNKQMKNRLDQLSSLIPSMSIEQLERFMLKEKYWKKTSTDHSKRIDLLLKMLEFRTRQHVEMLDLSQFTKIVDIKKLKILFSKSFFVNFTVQENGFNALLSLQGYFLKNFIYFHMKHDMRFKATIDSYMIEMDNPYTRQTIREENRKDPDLAEKYLGVNFNVEDFSVHLLENFFPNISGIWADYHHLCPAYILQFVRIAFEYGLISPTRALTILPLLQKAAVSLLKLEEGWVERPIENKKFSIRIKLHDIMNLFAKCREHLSMILVEILVLLNDDYFMKNYPKYVSEKEDVAVVQEEMIQNFSLFNKDINDAVLFIAMNFLSNNVQIMDYKSTNDFCKVAVEKIFLFLTTTQRDCFLNSLKQITITDLKYIDAKDMIASDLRERADSLGKSFRIFLELVGRGAFDKNTGKIDNNFISDKEYDKFLKRYASQEASTATIDNILKKVISEISSVIELEPDYKVAVVKESIPLMLVCMADYCTGYFEEPISSNISKDCFRMLLTLCQNNNFAKAQIFKGECLFHFRQLLARFDPESFMFLFNLCEERNVAVFLGREVFSYFLRLYEKFNNDICKGLDIDDPTRGLNIEKCGTLLLMSKFLLKLFSRTFLNEREKLQNILLTQESMFETVIVKYLPILLKLTNELAQESSSREVTTVTNDLYRDGNEALLLKRLSRADLDGISRKILAAHVAYFSVRLLNSLCYDCFSAYTLDKVQPLIKQVIAYLESSPVQSSDWALPIGLEAEYVKLLKNFKVLWQQRTLIEYPIHMEATVLEASSYGPRAEIKEQIKDLNLKINEIRMEDRENDRADNPSSIAKIKGIQSQIDQLNLQQTSIIYKTLHLFQSLFNRLEQFKDKITLKSEAKLYLVEGLIPIIYSYVLSIKNLAVLNNSKKIKYNYYKIVIIAKELCLKKNLIEQFISRTITWDLSSVGLGEEDVLNNIFYKDGVLQFVDKQIQEKRSLEQLERTIRKGSEMILTALEDLVQGGLPSSGNEGLSRKDISKEEYIASIYAAKFEEQSSDDYLKLKAATLNDFIKEYQEAKDMYLNRDEEPNLMSFFDRNTQNLRGVFSSCVDRLLTRTKTERHSKKNYLSYAVPMSRFWNTPSCNAYVNMVTMLVSKSSTARNELYEFIKEDEISDEHENEIPEDTNRGGPKTPEKRQLSVDEIRDLEYPKSALLSVLIRIHSDLAFFLSSNNKRNTIWWVTHQTYEMISMFFKNLCECNFMPFKRYLGENNPIIYDHNWESLAHKSYTHIFSAQMDFLLKTSQLSENKDPVIKESDCHEKVQEILLPVVKILNESIIGPCKVNQLILIKWDLTGLCNLATRLLDDMDSSYNKLAAECLGLILALTEGRNEMILSKISQKIPASIITDRILRQTKKLYIRQLIIAGKYDDYKSDKTKLKEKQEEEEEESKRKIKNNQIMPITEAELAEIKKEREAKENPCVIDETMEKRVTIEDWDDLLEMYMDEKDFSESPVFDFVFKLLVLWKILSTQSKSHQNRMDDAKYESKLYFKNESRTDFTLKRVVAPEFACVFYFLTKKILVEIEVLDPENNSVIMNFPRLPQCFMLSIEARKNYLSDCDISDSNTKMLDLLRNFDLFCIQMESSFVTSRKLGRLYNVISTDAFYWYTNFCWILGFALNVVLCLGWVRIGTNDYFLPNNNSYSVLATVLAIILIVVSCLLLVLWLLTKYSQTYATKMEDYKFEHPGVNANRFGVKLYVAIYSSFLSQAFPISYALHILFTALGLSTFTVFYSLNLLLIINISKTTKFVLQAILLHIDQLALTLMLAMFVIFCYTMLIMDNLYDQISLDSGNNVCDQLYTCFFYVFNLGLRNGGGFAESLVGINKEKKFPARTVFDISFFMLINVISLNVIFGIIIDTFSQLRDDQYARGKPESNRSKRRGGQLLRLRQHASRLQQEELELQHAHSRTARAMELHLLHLLPQ